MMDPGISVQYGGGGSSFSWMTFATGVVTAAAALTGSWLGNAYQARLQRDRLTADDKVRDRAALRAHGEEIVTLVREWLDVFANGLRDLERDLLHNSIRPETVAKIEYGEKITRATMLTRIDFPESVDLLDLLLKCRSEGNDILVSGQNAGNSVERRIQAERIEVHHVSLNAAQRDFSRAITKAIGDRTSTV